ncbi:MAG: hypothetical protein Q7U12_07610, partial [Undibacterium sp.]|nr:hypothetical protein [Undibacterium sp.]
RWHSSVDAESDCNTAARSPINYNATSFGFEAIIVSVWNTRKADAAKIPRLIQLGQRTHGFYPVRW